jgi:hypothetical protein
MSLLIRSWPLLALSALSILFLLGIVTESDLVVNRHSPVPIVFGIVVLALCGRWFMHLRSGQSPHDSN